ncbi:transposable element Tcb1 transposase [Trichonephila clavipes]|nr:transposable element Tcb1 transposase [Trichonephila clavipes]
MANNQSVRRHLDAFTRGRIIGKLEERRSVTSVAAEFELLTASFHDFGDDFKTTGTAIRGRFTVARRLHGGGLFARRSVRCVPLTPSHRRRRSLWCRNTGIGETMNGDEYSFTDESRFSLSSDSHRILIWKEREAAIIPRTSLKGTGMEVAVFSFGKHHACGRTDLHIFDAGSVNGTRYRNEILLPYVSLLERRYGSAVPFHGRQCTMSSHSSCRTALREQTLGSSYLTTSNDSGADWRCKTNGQQCLNNSLTPSFSAWADAVKPA